MQKTTWKFDPTHSELRFRIRHLMISNVSGSFQSFNVEMTTDGEDITTAQIMLTAEAKSVTTGNEQRDAHLRNPDFFDSDNFPALEFNSTAVRKKDDENYIVEGNLVIKGISRPVSLQVEYNGTTKDPWGNTRAGFVVSARINRSDWGISFNSVLETGGVALSDEVKISADVQMVRENN